MKQTTLYIGVATVAALFAGGCNDKESLFGACLPKTDDPSFTNELAFFDGGGTAFEANFSHDDFLIFVVDARQDAVVVEPGEYELVGDSKDDPAPIRVGIVKTSDGVVNYGQVSGTATIEAIGTHVGDVFSGCVDAKLKGKENGCSGWIDLCWSRPIDKVWDSP